MTMNKNDIEIKVRGYHLDLYQHVNNARYLEFLEEARWAYFETVLIDGIFDAQNLGFVVVNINISYRYPSYLNDTLVIHTTEKEIGKRKVILQQLITNKANNKLIAEADVTFVIIDKSTGKSVELSEDILQSIFPNNGN